jgi:hypothetical protein
LTQAGVRQHEIVIPLEQGQLLAQPGFVFAQRVDPTTNGGNMLREVEIEALHKRGVDLPPPFGQHLLDRLQRTEYDVVLDTYDASAPIRFDHLGLEEFGPWHPAWLGHRPLSLATLGWHPLAVMGDQRGEVLPKAVRQKQRGTVRG